MQDRDFDAGRFRRALGEYGTGVTVITTRAGEQPFGMTSNSFASVSLDPPLVLWSIRRESTCFDVFAGCTHFAVNVLSAGQIALSRRFAQTGTGRFRDLTWRDGAGGAPVGTIARPARKPIRISAGNATSHSCERPGTIRQSNPSRSSR